MLSRILLFVVILALPLNFSVRTLEIPSAPPLVNASCMWLSLKPEAAIFSAIPFDTAVELMSGCRVLRFCFLWPRNTVYVSTHDVVKLCYNRVLSVIYLNASSCRMRTSCNALWALSVLSRRSCARCSWLQDVLSGNSCLKAGRVSEKPSTT